MQDFKAFKDAPEVMDNPRFFNRYPKLVGDVMKELYEIPAGPKARIYPTIRKQMSFKEIWAMGKDFRQVKKI